MTSEPQRTRRISIVVLLACLALSLICVVYPIYVIRPFRAQGARELAIALVVMRFRSAATLISGVAALYAPVGACFVFAIAALARVNVYELMFHPDDRPSFAAASRMKLDKDEKVIAVKIGGAARAYPIRNISYHHVINDVLGKVAIVATY